MDLTYRPEYEAFRQEVRQFIETHRHLAPLRPTLGDHAFDSDRKQLMQWQQVLIDHGLAARSIPREYGGYGAEVDVLKSHIIAEEFAAAQIAPGLGGQGIAYLVPTLLEWGSESIKQRFIPPTIRGEILWCEGFSEPNAGSDLASLQTRAVLEGDQWIVNGQKIWTSTADAAEWMFCLVRTEPDQPKHRGISFLLFAMDSPGIEVRPLRQMTGDATFSEVFFTDLHVPKDQIVGQRGQGWQVATRLLYHERLDLGDPNLTQIRLNALIQLMQTETVDGRRIIDDPIYRDRLMRIQGEVMAMRFHDLRLLSERAKQHEDPIAASIVKLQGCELRHQLEQLAVDALGELGLLYEDSPYVRDGGSWQYMYMYYLGLIIGGGTAQIQRNIISERGLGMPREPKLQ